MSDLSQRGWNSTDHRQRQQIIFFSAAQGKMLEKHTSSLYEVGNVDIYGHESDFLIFKETLYY